MKSILLLITLFCFTLATLLLWCAAGFATATVGELWSPYLEWSLINDSYAINPFDLTASVIFTHIDSGDTIESRMFYSGGDTWKFRFTGTRVGTWSYLTLSTDADLDGDSGTIIINDDPDTNPSGFVTNSGNKWLWSGSNKPFVPQLVMFGSPDLYTQQMVDAGVDTFIIDHGFNGFHAFVACRWFDIEHEASYDIDSLDPNPDTRTFEALERLILSAGAAGGMVHMWVWGDDQRDQTPYKWGMNGAVDKRLQRYIAARLGPLPGWTMGYGFDLNEWVDQQDLQEWHAYMHQHLGWTHFLGGRSVGPNIYYPGVEFPQVYEGLDYSGYEQHQPTYEAYVAAIEARPLKPTFSEDRFRVRDPSPYPDKDYTLELTRRGLWNSTMAGGVANIWGYLPNPSVSQPYPNKDHIKTYSLFFQDRFFTDMQRANDLTDSYCLKRPDNSLFLFYKEDADTMMIDLSAWDGKGRAAAVDTKLPYLELGLSLTPGIQTWQAYYKSDWAIVVEPFDIQSISKNGEDVTIKWNARPGNSYSVHWSLNLDIWNEVFTGQIGEWTDTNTDPYQHKHYRIQVAE